MSGPTFEESQLGSESPQNRIDDATSLPDRLRMEDDIDLRKLWDVIWSAKWLIAGGTTLFLIVGVVIALLAPPWYRAEVVLMPVTEGGGSGLLAQLGELGDLAGLSGAGISGVSDTAEPIALLKSRQIAREFIEEQGLLPILFAKKWDPVREEWRVEGRRVPDIRDALRVFERSVRKVQEDRKTGLVTLAIEWTDPVLAAQWANQLASKIDEPMRRRTIAQATENIRYLQGELAATNVVAMEEAIGRLLQGEMQRLMIARGRQEVAFRILDPAYPPKKKIRPKRTMIVLLSGILGAGLCLVIVFVRSLFGKLSVELKGRA